MVDYGLKKIINPVKDGVSEMSSLVYSEEQFKTTPKYK